MAYPGFPNRPSFVEDIFGQADENAASQISNPLLQALMAQQEQEKNPDLLQPQQIYNQPSIIQTLLAGLAGTQNLPFTVGQWQEQKAQQVQENRYVAAENERRMEGHRSRLDEIRLKLAETKAEAEKFRAGLRGRREERAAGDFADTELAKLKHGFALEEGIAEDKMARDRIELQNKLETSGDKRVDARVKESIEPEFGSAYNRVEAILRGRPSYTLMTEDGPQSIEFVKEGYPDPHTLTPANRAAMAREIADHAYQNMLTQATGETDEYVRDKLEAQVEARALRLRALQAMYIPEDVGETEGTVEAKEGGKSFRNSPGFKMAQKYPFGLASKYGPGLVKGAYKELFPGFYERGQARALGASMVEAAETTDAFLNGEMGSGADSTGITFKPLSQVEMARQQWDSTRVRGRRLSKDQPDSTSPHRIGERPSSEYPYPQPIFDSPLYQNPRWGERKR